MRYLIYIWIVIGLVITRTEAQNWPEPYLLMEVNGERIHYAFPSLPLVINLTFVYDQDLSYDQVVSYLPESVLNDEEEMNRYDSLYRRGFIQFYEDKPWYEEIFFEIKVEDEFQPLNDYIHLLLPHPEDTLRLGFNKNEFVNFGIDPMEILHIGDFPLIIRSGIFLDQIGEVLYSNTVRVELAEDVEGQTFSNRELRRLSRYWVERGECDIAMEYAGEVYGRNPDLPDNIIILGDVMACQEEFNTALSLYLTAMEMILDQSREGDCPPAYLQQKIIELQRMFE